MSYTEFKKQHDQLVTDIIFTGNSRADTLVERLERLRLDNEKHFNQLWGEL
jgi:hypothetical protein